MHPSMSNLSVLTCLTSMLILLPSKSHRKYWINSMVCITIYYLSLIILFSVCLFVCLFFQSFILFLLPLSVLSISFSSEVCFYPSATTQSKGKMYHLAEKSSRNESSFGVSTVVGTSSAVEASTDDATYTECTPSS